MEQDYSRSRVKSIRVPWNKGKLVGAKPPLRPSHVWSIQTKLQIDSKKRDLALFNLAIDSKLRGCDVVAVRVDDVAPSGYSMDRTTIRQKKTGRPVRFELTDQTRQIACDRTTTWLFRDVSSSLTRKSLHQALSSAAIMTSMTSTSSCWV